MNTPTAPVDACDPTPAPRTLANIFTRTAIVQPSRTGGGDHSLSANMHGDPMIFGGRRYERDALCDPQRSMTTKRIVMVGGWIMRQGWRFSAKVITAKVPVCTGMVTA
jgi:hypothetical protein